jgi:hypothetical protein
MDRIIVGFILGFIVGALAMLLLLACVRYSR